jgi:hypothetical protein
MCAPPDDAAGTEQGQGPEAAPEVVPAPEPVTAEAVRIAEAVLFASDRPVQPARLQSVLPDGQSAAAVLASCGRCWPAAAWSWRRLPAASRCAPPPTWPRR